MSPAEKMREDAAGDAEDGGEHLAIVDIIREHGSDEGAVDASFAVRAKIAAAIRALPCEEAEPTREAPRRCDDAAQAWREVAEGLERERDLRAKLGVVGADADGVWFWQGDGYDHPASLSCPVVMSADTLRAILGREQALLRAVEEARGHLESIGGLDADGNDSNPDDHIAAALHALSPVAPASPEPTPQEMAAELFPAEEDRRRAGAVVGIIAERARRGER